MSFAPAGVIVLLAVSSTLMIQQQSTSEKKEKETHWSVHVAAPESAKVTSIVHKESMKNLLKLWIHEVMEKKKPSGQQYCDTEY